MSTAERMPALFIGHGSPENAYLDNAFTRRLKQLRREMPEPKAVLCISAHWLTEGTCVSTAARPATIHDFGGFPERLYRMAYPAPGAPEIARKVQRMIKKPPVDTSTSRGLDHGTWVVMKHLYPEADIPVFQMSIDYYKPPEFHYALGGQLAPLRRQGVLIIGSGNIVHNLRILYYGDIDAKPFDWAVKFDARVKACLDSGHQRELAAYEKWGGMSRMAHPTPDHYYPLLYAAALREKGDALSYPYEGFQYASLSMRAVRIG